MHPTSKNVTPNAHRLVAPPGSSPSRTKSRQRIVAVTAGVTLLASAVVILVVAFAVADRSTPEASIAPSASGAGGGEPVAAPAAATQQVKETKLPSGDAWLSLPAQEPVGVAIVLPDAHERAAGLLDTPAAEGLRAAGWAVATGALGGESWGSAAASDGLAQLHDWAIQNTGELPVLLSGRGMGATTGVTTLARHPDLGVACFYAAAPVTDLAALVGRDPALGARIAQAWGREPTLDDNPILLAPSLPESVVYRVIVPDAPTVLADDANAFVASLDASGHTVSSVTAAVDDGADADDLTTFAEGCLG